MLYFLQARGGGPIKIGYTASSSARARRTAAQLGSPEELVVVVECDGSVQDDRDLRAALTSDHIRGDWYTSSHVLRELIDLLLDGARLRDWLDALPKPAPL